MTIETETGVGTSPSEPCELRYATAGLAEFDADRDLSLIAWVNRRKVRSIIEQEPLNAHRLIGAAQ